MLIIAPEKLYMKDGGCITLGDDQKKLGRV